MHAFTYINSWYCYLGQDARGGRLDRVELPLHKFRVILLRFLSTHKQLWPLPIGRTVGREVAENTGSDKICHHSLLRFDDSPKYNIRPRINISEATRVAPCRKSHSTRTGVRW